MCTLCLILRQVASVMSNKKRGVAGGQWQVKNNYLPLATYSLCHAPGEDQGHRAGRPLTG